MGLYNNCKIYKIWILFKIVLSSWIYYSNCAVLPPSWANADLNPCALEPGGWQLLYWPPDGKCYKIFQMGSPCPDDMELVPITSKITKKVHAECHCPPQKAQHETTGRCYALFSAGPCDRGSYFAPTEKNNKNQSLTRHWGTCRPMKICQETNHLYWPKDGKCYQQLTRGPCAKGHLLTADSNHMTVCDCNKGRELRKYRYSDGYCYQHFSKGPCKEKGQLYLPDQTCGCYSFLPHFHEDTQKCFELGRIGPCNKGEIFTISPETGKGTCWCKQDYIRYRNSTTCNRPYTQGPCDKGHILTDENTCIPLPCSRGELYFPEESQCFRIGTQGPCSPGKLVSFDFNTRPSLDGVSYNGKCTCQNKDCSYPTTQCDITKRFVRYKNNQNCYKLYTQGPCPEGAWIAPKRQVRHHSSNTENNHKLSSETLTNRTKIIEEDIVNRIKNLVGTNSSTNDVSSSPSVEGLELFDDSVVVVVGEVVGVCECRPGHVRKVRMIGEKPVAECASPALILVDYLNKNYTKT